MVKIIGHRGAAGYAPENTIPSFQAAIDIGCDRTELDVRLSKDGEVVVFHDEEVSRVTDGYGLIRDLSLAEIKKPNCGQGQKIPTLQEVIDLCKGKINLQIELKAPGTPLLVNEMFLQNGLVDDAVITSFNPDLLQEIKKINPRLKIGLLFSKYSEEIWASVKEIPLDFIGPRRDIVTKEMIDKAHGLSKIVFAYHVNDKDVGEKLIALGVDEIGTDFPKLFIKR